MPTKKKPQRPPAGHNTVWKKLKAHLNRMDLPSYVWMPIVIASVVYVAHNKWRDIFRNSSQNMKSSRNWSKSLDYYDWIPSTPAKIDDPVDDSNFNYNVLKALKMKKIRLEDRDIAPLELKPKRRVNSTVRVFLIDDLFSEEESDVYRHLHHRHIEDQSKLPAIVCFDHVSTLREHLKDLKQNLWISESIFTPGTRCVNTSFSSQLYRWGMRWSFGTAFYPKENEFSTDLGRRLFSATGFHEDNGGAFRIVSYAQNTGYKLHTDCSMDGHRGTEDRFGTILVYLSDVAIGGHTYFPELGISVKPKKGRALVWNNMTPSGKCDPTSKHAAKPVIKGHKYILQRWYYYQNYPGIQNRPPIPPIPERHPGQANVNCDEYKHGSCRWYDTWTYDVLTKY